VNAIYCTMVLVDTLVSGVRDVPDGDHDLDRDSVAVRRATGREDGPSRLAAAGVAFSEEQVGRTVGSVRATCGAWPVDRLELVGP